MGIEPMTSFLPRMRSTPELRGLASHTTLSSRSSKLLQLAVKVGGEGFEPP